jgi:hypothetical protein
MSLHPLTEMEISEVRAQLHELQLEHRDLDQVINHLSITRRLKICWFVD